MAAAVDECSKRGIKCAKGPMMAAVLKRWCLSLVDVDADTSTDSILEALFETRSIGQATCLQAVLRHVLSIGSDALQYWRAFLKTIEAIGIRAARAC